MKTGLARPTPRRRQPFPSEAPSSHAEMRAAGPTGDGKQTGRPRGSAVFMPNLVHLSCEEAAAPSGERRESPGRGGGGAARDREAALAEHVWAFVPQRERGISAAEELTGSSGSPAVKGALVSHLLIHPLPWTSSGAMEDASHLRTCRAKDHFPGVLWNTSCGLGSV